MSSTALNNGNMAADLPGNRKVMIVDDDNVILHALRIRLAHEGFDVRAFRDGTTALGQMGSFEPTVAVLDVNMPGLNGMQLGAKIQDQHPDCRLVFLTASRDDRLRLEAEPLSVFAYMEKPYGSRDLIERIAASVTA